MASSIDREKIVNAIEKAKKQSEEYAQDRIIVPLKEADMILAMLKEQEAVEPTIDEYGNKRCGNCGHKLHSIADIDLFCCKCGQAVKWDDL
jgi:protein-arginine kinase activator protein McsA